MQIEQLNKRRDFFKTAATLTTAVIAPSFLKAMSSIDTDANKGGDGFKFLFQGDSITDGNRSRNNDWNHVMGHGFAYLVCSRLAYDFPAKRFQFFNRGVSGNKVTDLSARWQKDTLELQPDVLTILIGINDTSAWINGNKSFTAGQYEDGYRALLQQTRQQLPNVQLVLCEPFILPVGKVMEKWELYSPEIEQRRQAVKRLAGEFNAIFVAFQDIFDKALLRAPAEYWIWDGVHPMPAGHELMAREWISRVRKKLKFIK